MGGEARSQTMDATLGLEPCVAARPVIDVLGSALADGVLIVTLGEEPFHRTMDAVPGTELNEEILADGYEALASALGIGDAELATRGVDVGEADVGGL